MFFPHLVILVCILLYDCCWPLQRQICHRKHLPFCLLRLSTYDALIDSFQILQCKRLPILFNIPGIEPSLRDDCRMVEQIHQRIVTQLLDLLEKVCDQNAESGLVFFCSQLFYNGRELGKLLIACACHNGICDQRVHRCPALPK